MLQAFDKFARRRSNMIKNVYDNRAGMRANQFYRTPASMARGEAARRDNAETAAEALDAIQVIVGALASPDGATYAASFGEESETILGHRRVTVTSKPLFDDTLKLRDACIILTGLAVHEIMHTYVSPQTEAILNDRWPGNRTVKFIANVLDDLRGDAEQRRRFPGAAFAIKPTLKYMVKAYSLDREPIRFDVRSALSTKLTFMLVATRYAPYLRWIGNDTTRSERAWWNDWAARGSLARTDDEIIASLEEAIIRLKTEPPPEERPEQQPQQGDEAEDPNEPEPEDTDDDADDDDADDDTLGSTEEGTADAEPEDEPESEPEDEQAETGSSDDTDDEAPESDDKESEGEGNDDESESNDDESEAGDPNAEQGEGDPDDSDPDEAQSDGKSESDADDIGDDIGGNADNDDPDEFDPDADYDDDGDEAEVDADGDTAMGDGNDSGSQDGDDIDEVVAGSPEATDIDDVDVPEVDLDSFNEPLDDDDKLQAAIVAERQIERVNRSDGFGSMRINVS